MNKSKIVNVFIQITRREKYWRVALICPGGIIWRAYSRKAYPTPEDVVSRCLRGLHLDALEKAKQGKSQEQPAKEKQNWPRIPGPAVVNAAKCGEDGSSEHKKKSGSLNRHRQAPFQRIRAQWQAWL